MPMSLTRHAGQDHTTAARIGRAILTGLMLAAALMPGAARAAGLVDPSGTWLISDGRARIRIEKCGPDDKNICGFVVWVKIPLDDQGKPRTDVKNPDPKKRARLILGHQIMLGLKPNEDDRYEGKVYNAEAGKLVDITTWSEDPGELKVHGCMLAILCGSQTWTQVKDVAPGQLTGPVNGPNGPRADPEWTPKPDHAKAKS